MNRRLSFLMVVMLFCSPTVYACKWDRDTLRYEASGMVDVQGAIIGAFPRNPAQYYEMRLERVAKELESDPNNLALYDDAGVACDTLGRADEAIEWMRRKREVLTRVKYDPSKHEQPNHLYRYYANLGTFHAHRWLMSGADRSDTSDLEEAYRSIS